jgi:histidinol phosphatase-like PHP family hydrolase
MEFFDCHCHTERSACIDGASLAMYVERARGGAPAFAITDHSAHLFYPPDNRWAFWTDDAERIYEECEEAGRARCREHLRWLRQAQTGCMLVGVELDALPDGRVVYDEDLLPELDIILGAVHSIRSLGREEPLDKVVAEFRTRTGTLLEVGVDVLVHPFREWAQRQREVPGEVMEWLVAAAGEARVALELNCHYPVPQCDVPMVRLCAEQGVKVAIGTDTHRPHEFGDFTYHERILAQAGLGKDTWEAVTMGWGGRVLASTGGPGAGAGERH